MNEVATPNRTGGVRKCASQPESVTREAVEHLQSNYSYIIHQLDAFRLDKRAGEFGRSFGI